MEGEVRRTCKGAFPFFWEAYSTRSVLHGVPVCVARGSILHTSGRPRWYAVQGTMGLGFKDPKP